FCSARSTDRAALATLRFWRRARATASSRVSTSGPPTVSADTGTLTARARTVQNDIPRIASVPFRGLDGRRAPPFPRRVPTAACDSNSPRMLDLPVRRRVHRSPRASGRGGSGSPLLAETRQGASRPALECGAMPRPPEQGAEALQTALSSVARAIADSLELKEVWDRVAEACRTIVPFDGMGVSRLQPGDVVRVVAVTSDSGADQLVEAEFTRSDYSPKLWPGADDYLLIIDDAPKEVDQAFAVDRYVVGRGHRSIMRVPLGRGQGRVGSLILTAHEPHRFTEAHGRSLTLVAELVALALAHEKLASRWRERKKQREALERLVPTLSGTLDVRQVFEQIGHIAEEIVPCDFMALTLLSDDRQVEHAYAKAGLEGDVHEMPEFPVPRELQHTLDWDYLIARDISVVGGRRIQMHLLNLDPLPPTLLEFESSDAWVDLHSEVGIRSIMRANVRRSGVPIGGLIFASHHRAQFDDDHAEFAMRVADHVALALAHHDLAEESRRTAAAQDRAAQLEERVHVLAQELETLTPHRALGRSRKWKEVLAQATKVAPTDTTVLM